MLHSLELENFKAFGKRVKIPLKPITLIYGQNSAGKSSILQALYMMRRSYEMKQGDSALAFKDTEGMYDLGSFRDCVFRHNTNLRIGIRINHIVTELADGTCHGQFTQRQKQEKERTEISSVLSRALGPKQNRIIGVDYEFCKGIDAGIALVDEAALFADDLTHPILHIRRSGSIPKRRMPEPRGKMVRSLPPGKLQKAGEMFMVGVPYEIVKISEEMNHWDYYWRYLLQYRHDIIEAFKVYAFNIELINTLDKSTTFPFNNDKDDLPGIEFVEDAVRFYSKEFELEDIIQRFLSVESNAVENSIFVTLNGLSVAASDLIMSHGTTFDHGFITGDEEDYLWNIWEGYFEHSPIGHLVTNGVLQSTGDTLNRIVPLGPLRQRVDRYFQSGGNPVLTIGPDGAGMPEFLLKERGFLFSLNRCLSERLSLNYEVNISQVTKSIPDLFQIRLRDLKAKGKRVHVALTDVGVGVSQILPIVVQALFQKDSIVTVEQPELHIHPKLQADLGDVFIEGIKKENPNQFIIETHSEHLILRLLRRIRESYDVESIAPNSRPLTPDDVCVLYVQRGPAGSTVTELPITPDGDFSKDWPDGFFEERARELFDEDL